VVWRVPRTIHDVKWYVRVRVCLWRKEQEKEGGVMECVHLDVLT